MKVTALKFTKITDFTEISVFQGRRPAPLKLRPYGAIQICLLLLLLLLFTENVTAVKS